MTEAPLWTYYADLDRLAAHLDDRGRAAEGSSLRDAVAGGATSGEILSRTGVVLRSLDLGTLEDDLVQEVRRLAAECAALWDGAT